MDTHQLFNSPPTSIGSVLGLVSSIFFSRWKQFALMGLLYYVSILVASIVLVLISWLAFSQTFMKIMANIPTGASGGYGSIGARHLLDYAVGHSGTSRALQYYDNNDYNDYESAASGLLAIGVELVLIYLLFVAILTFVASIFVGALNHFVAEIYTGGTPSVSRSLAYGWEKKWKVYVFQVLLMLAVLAIIVVDVGIPAAAGHAILGWAIAVVMLVIMSTVLLGAVPAIVVENKTPIDAFHRSYNLCKNYFCFIFCNQFMFNVIVLVFSIVNNLALAKAPAVVSFIVHFLINVIMFSIGPILVMVLYMSIRIRSEQLTGQELSDELCDIVPVASAAETSDSVGDIVPVASAVETSDSVGANRLAFKYGAVKMRDDYNDDDSKPIV